MRLFTKTYLILSLAGAFILCFGSFYFYHVITATFQEEVDENLRAQRKEWRHFLEDYRRIPTAEISGIQQRVFYNEAPFKGIRDTSILYRSEFELVRYRKITFEANIDTVKTITLCQSMMETEDLTETVQQTFLLIAVLLMLIFLLLSYFISKYTWLPFRHALSQLRSFTINNQEVFIPRDTNTKEFKELNGVLQQLTKKIISDFKSLKSFTENASHELQTPLAVIRSKCELLLQDDKLTEKNMQLIQQIYENTNQLSRLNSSLLLLAKIENRQFELQKDFNLSDFLREKIKYFDELLQLNNIRLSTNINSGVKVNTHPELADILFSNLIRNAFQHNNEQKIIRISLEQDHFIISNSGPETTADNELIFMRFFKGNTRHDSTGLGLAIVKEIVELNHWKIDYHFSDGIHTFFIKFQH